MLVTKKKIQKIEVTGYVVRMGEGRSASKIVTDKLTVRRLLDSLTTLKWVNKY